MLKIKTPYSDCWVTINHKRYAGNGRHVLELRDVDDGSVVMIATTNLPHVDLGPSEVIIKNYSENEGVLEFLQENGIVGPVKREVPTGWVTCQIVDLLKTSA